MSVALADLSGAVEVRRQGIGGQDAGVCAQPQRAADVLHAVLIRHQGDDGVAGVGV